MLDKLVEFLTSILHLFFLWRIIDDYERGVRLRFGVYNGKILGPGRHWQWPLAIDEIMSETVVTKTLSLGMQSLNSCDNGKAMAFQAVIEYTVEDIAKYLLRVDEPEGSISDRCSGAIRPVLAALRHGDLMGLDRDSTNALLRPVCRKVTTRWGVSINNVSLPDLTTVRPIRLLQE